MRALTASELLAVWERGLALPSAERALLLLGAACGDESADRLARLSVGERDARLLTLREWTFGRELMSLVGCPKCGEKLELNLDAADLRAMPATNDGAGNGTATVSTSEPLTVATAGYEALFRLPNSLDLAAIAEAAPAGVGDAATALLERCLIEARRGDERVSAAELPPEVAREIAERMSEADPQGEIALSLNCPACGESWQSPFDIESFFWTEIGAWARRILGEVHILASSYGWREADILNMSAWRRRFYLELISG